MLVPQCQARTELRHRGRRFHRVIPFQHQCFVMVSLTVALWVRPPPVPVTVIVDVPLTADKATAIVMVELPEPGAAIGFGPKLTVTPLG